MTLQKPKTQLQEVLYELINRNSISVKQMLLDTGILNIKARISDLRLRYNLPIETSQIRTINKHNRPVHYGSWKLTDKQQGINLYKQLQDDNVGKNNRVV